MVIPINADLSRVIGLVMDDIIGYGYKRFEGLTSFTEVWFETTGTLYSTLELNRVAMKRSG